MNDETDLGVNDAAAEFERIAAETLTMHDGDGSRLGYFAALYHGVTLGLIGPVRFQPGVRGHQGSGSFFDNPARMDQFIWIFANRYFRAYEKRNELGASHPWKQHFDYCEDPNATILQILTSGANAHMVLDLPMAAINVSDAADTPIDDLQHDFNRINQVLAWQIEACQAQVLQVSPVLRIINRVPRLTAWLVKKLIGWARAIGWQNALTVEPDPHGPLGGPADATTEQELVDEVGQWAKRITRPPLPIHLFLRYLVAPFEKASPKDITRHLMTVQLPQEQIEILQDRRLFAEAGSSAPAKAWLQAEASAAARGQSPEA